MSAKKPEPRGYLVDSNGNKTCVILTVQDYEELLEELEDLADIAEGRDEELIPHEEVTRILKDDGLL